MNPNNSWRDDCQLTEHHRTARSSVREDRRTLDRNHPATLTTEYASGTVYHWVRAGDTEVCAANAAEQRMIATLHNVGRVNDRLRTFDTDLSRRLGQAIRPPQVEITSGGDAA